MTVGAIQSRHSRPAAARSQLGRGATARRGIRLGRHVRHPPLAKPGDPEASSGPGDGEQRLDSDQRTREPCTRSHPARTSCPCTSRSTRAGKPCGVQIWGDVDLSNHHRLPPRSPRSTLRVSMQSTWTSDSCHSRGCEFLLVFERKSRLSVHLDQRPRRHSYCPQGRRLYLRRGDLHLSPYRSLRALATPRCCVDGGGPGSQPVPRPVQACHAYRGKPPHPSAA
jgi:hypothetical protein